MRAAGEYIYSEGTSVATAYVCGIAGLILSMDNTLSTEEEIYLSEK